MVFGSIVAKNWLRPALNLVFGRIVAKIWLRPALNSVFGRIVAKIRLLPALNPVLSPMEHSLAGHEKVLEGFFEVSGVPGVCHVPAHAGVGHHQMDFALRV